MTLAELITKFVAIASTTNPPPRTWPDHQVYVYAGSIVTVLFNVKPELDFTPSQIRGLELWIGNKSPDQLFHLFWPSHDRHASQQAHAEEP